MLYALLEFAFVHYALWLCRLLCDDPGLGKTITVISLILRSFGLSTEAKADSDQDGDDDLFYSFWYSSFLTKHVRKPALLQLLTCVIKSDSESVWFVPPIDEYLDECPDYFDVISIHYHDLICLLHFLTLFKPNRFYKIGH